MKWFWIIGYLIFFGFALWMHFMGKDATLFAALGIVYFVGYRTEDDE